MKIVLLSGGVGKRLWPISTEKMPKQFLKFGQNETMLVSTYKKACNISDSVYVATQEKQSKIVKSQLNNLVSIINEPSLHGTFGTMLNIANYFKYKEKFEENEIIVTIPIDHCVDDEFYDLLKKIPTYLSGNVDFCLIGIKPTYPSTEFGYIVENSNMVSNFVEKPIENRAIDLINHGAYWNSGVLAFRLGTMNEISNKYFKTTNYKKFYANYNKLPKNSFDKEVLEKSKKIYVIKTDSRWEDLGTWKHLCNKISESDEYNTNIINTEKKIIINNGIENSIIVNTSNGIALFAKDEKKISYRNWGVYKVLSCFKLNDENIKIKYLKINDKVNTSYQCHLFREELWNVISGTGIAIIDGKHINLKAGDLLRVEKNQKHILRGINDLEIIEIQKGKKTIESDIVRYESEWENVIKRC